jgi:hypothetical protein
MFKKILIANHPVIASEARQSSSMPAILDCRVATLLAMTRRGENTDV